MGRFQCGFYLLVYVCRQSHYSHRHIFKIIKLHVQVFDKSKNYPLWVFFLNSLIYVTQAFEHYVNFDQFYHFWLKKLPRVYGTMNNFCSYGESSLTMALHVTDNQGKSVTRFGISHGICVLTTIRAIYGIKWGE